VSERKIKPRPALVVRASYVSQETCFAVLGITARKFLDVIVPKCAGVARLGRTAVVPLDEAERVLAAMALDEAPEADDRVEPDEDDDEQPTTADEVLRRLGKERVA
jgi:hypothetical protein